MAQQPQSRHETPHEKHIRLLISVLKAHRNGQKLESIPNYSTLDPYLKKARWVKRGIHLFRGVIDGLAAALNIECGDEDAGAVEGNAEREGEGDGLTAEQREEQAAAEAAKDLQFGEAILALFPAQSKKTFTAIGESDMDLLMYLLHLFRKKADDGRNDTNSSLSSRFLNYLKSPRDDPWIGTRLLPGDLKGLRGYNSADCGRLMIPLRHQKKFDKDPVRFAQLIKTKKVKITEEDWPAFLYPEGMKWNPRKTFDKLFEGHVVARMLCHEMTGPSTAFGGRIGKNQRTTNSELHKESSIRPPHVAYACALAYFQLSSLGVWAEKDAETDFCIRTFYENILDVLSSDTDWARETLATLTKKVPYLNMRSHKAVGPPAPRNRNPVALIYRQLGGEDVDDQGPSDDEIDIESSQESQHAPHGDAQPRIPSPRQPNRHEDQRAPSPRQLTRDEDQHLPSPRQPARRDERADQRASDTQRSNHNALGNRTRSVLQTVDLNQPPPKEVPERPRDLEKELFDSDLDDPEDEEADQEQSGGGVVEEVDEFLQSLEEEGEGEEDIQRQVSVAAFTATELIMPFSGYDGIQEAQAFQCCGVGG
ncbi:hypothetical protein BKA70DRAFT_1334789 [Coprinopsis sp. MPI-PUGE-AT-0042]|nr:hypothetical protein BKA70DRAFT_1334789 [Coprinopsis sp. MPI-PUGE-AT-0042]